jgi:hypothetical protein
MKDGYRYLTKAGKKKQPHNSSCFMLRMVAPTEKASGSANMSNVATSKGDFTIH